MPFRPLPLLSCLFAILIGTLASAQSSRAPRVNEPAKLQTVRGSPAKVRPSTLRTPPTQGPAFKSPIMQQLREETGKNDQRAHPSPRPGSSSLFLTTPPAYAVGSQPLGLATGDFNSDGEKDVVVAANPPALLLGNGNGTLQAAIPIGTIAAYGVAVADFNHDGELDVAFATPGAAVVYLGHGDGTFGASSTFSTGGTNENEPPRILAADVNGDGFYDLILSTDTGVSVLLGKGNGTFHSPRTSSFPTAVASMTVADFNKDGRLDLAVSDGFSTLSILLGNGKGTFTLTSSYPATNAGDGLASADFNRDGNPDVALPNGQVFLGNGDGTLRPPGTFETSPNASAVAAVDVNGDGIPDLVTTSGGGFCGTADFGTTGVSLGNGDGTFQAVTVFDSGGCGQEVSIASVDLNGDGFPDIVVGFSQESLSGPTSGLSILLSRGNGTFPGAAELNIAGGSGGIALGDFNRDGNLDLAMADGSIYLGSREGTLKFLATASLGGVQIASGYFSNNGKLDLAAAVECVSAGCASEGELAVSLGNGDGTFQPVTSLPSGGFFAESLVIGDFNNDGNPDIAVLNNCLDVNCSSPGGSVTIFLGNGGGTFGPGNTITLSQVPFGGNPLAVVAGDFNNDGNIDLAAVGCSASCFPTPGVVSVLLGNGNGTFQSPMVLQTSSGGGVTSAVVGDFNQDGILDLAMANGAVCADCGGQGSIMYGNGDGTFRDGGALLTDGGPPASIVAADFQGIGSLTPVLANRCGDFLDCPDGSVMNVSAPDIMLLYLAAGDFNNDGKIDLAGSLQYDTGASVLLNVGGTLAATTTTLSPAALQSYSAFQPANFTAQIQHTGPQLSTGVVNFLDNGVSIGSVSLASNGQASFTTSQLAVGSHFVVAYYRGDGNFAASNSLGAHVTIARAPTTTTLSSNVNPSGYNQLIEFTATITPAFGTGATGKVTFYEGSKKIGIAPVIQGEAILVTRLRQLGTLSITARYDGDSNFLGSISNSLSQIVTPVTKATTLNWVKPGQGSL